MAQDIREKLGRFRILVVGRANAGKTTLLQRVCNTTEKPEIFDSLGNKIDAAVVEPFLDAGYPNIESGLVFGSNPDFIFHDSCGFEAGGEAEFKKMKEFVLERTSTMKLEERLHAIWYCIPMDESHRAITKAEEIFFSECDTSSVPVIAVFTKFDALWDDAFGQLKESGLTRMESKRMAPEKAKEDFAEMKIWDRLRETQYPPKDFVCLAEMDKDDADCGPLLEVTTRHIGAILTNEKQPILKPNDPKADLTSSHHDTHNTQISINMHPVQDFGPTIDDSDECTASLRPLIKYTEGNHFDLRGISGFLSSPDPNLQCAALQLLEHAAEWESANFTKCMSETFGPVADLLDSKNFQVHCAALDTLKPFLESPHAANTIKSMLPRILDAVLDALNSPEPLVQLATVEMLDAAARSEEILVEFSAAVSRIPSVLPSMLTSTQVVALRVLEVSAGSSTRELVKAVADTVQFLIQPLSSPETTVQIAALKVLEAGMGAKNDEIVRASKTILPILTKILSSGEPDAQTAARKVLEVGTRDNEQARGDVEAGDIEVRQRAETAVEQARKNAEAARADISKLILANQASQQKATGAQQAAMQAAAAAQVQSHAEMMAMVQAERAANEAYMQAEAAARTASDEAKQRAAEAEEETVKKVNATKEKAELQPPPSTPSSPPAPARSPSIATSPRKSQATPHVIVSRPEADAEDFSHRLKISTPSRPQQHSKQALQGKLFNPYADSIRMRRTSEPEAISDVTSNSSPPRNTPTTHHRDPPANRQLFDRRKDDPVRFAVSVFARPSSVGGRPTPIPKSSGDYVSGSSTSSYAHSMTSSSTLSSGTTDNSSASFALFDGKSREDPRNNSFAVQLKILYRNILALETKLLNEDPDDLDDGRVLLQGRGREISDEDLQQQKWMKLIADHKQLAVMMHNLLEISHTPSVPASVQVIPAKYNIIIRLWSHAFHKLLEALRSASFSSPLALEHLQDFIYYAYTFYTSLLEEPPLRSFRSDWLEALGDLARYRMAVAAMVTNNQLKGSALTTDAVSKAAAASENDELVTAKSKSQMSVKSSSNRPAARIDESPSPSIGIVAARMMDVEPEKQRWRNIAKEWYAQGLADTPGTGKLHHHLGLLSREVDNEELRAVYHFVKSMTTLCPFSTSQESVLPIWSSIAQSRRSQPDARAPELFVFLHGMLFTNIQLDDFSATLARFLERIEIEGAEEREWIMMAVVNIGAVLEYGRPGGVLRKIGVVGAREGGAGRAPVRVVAKKIRAMPTHLEDDGNEKRVDVDDVAFKGDPQVSPALSDANLPVDLPVPLKLAMELAFAMLSFVLRNPTRKASPFARSTLNPYLSVMLTFLATVTKHAEVLSVLERSIPWHDLTQFFATIPRNIFSAQGLNIPAGSERWAMLTSGCAPPLPEDWCLRGMEWVGRKVFERGYWKSGEERRVEVDVLDMEEGGQLTDGIIEDEDDEDEGHSRGESSHRETNKRWTRIVRSAVCLSSTVDGFTWVEGSREWRVEGTLEVKVRRWHEEDRLEREKEEERRRRGRRWTDDSMDVDGDDEDADALSEESEDDEDDSDEVKALKARRRYLRSLLVSGQRAPAPIQIAKQRSHPARSRKNSTMPSLNIVPGYTILVLDTDVILSSLSAVASIIESLRWTVVLPLPVIMELDGLSSNPSQLGEAAQEAVAYITSHVRSHSTSLKVQTSKGNYLTSLSVRIEQVDLTDENSWDRCMDNLILKAAIWQDEHWVDRSALLKNAPSVRDDTNAVKVVLLSLDRLLRLKARSRQLAAASEKDLAAILASGT